jgi:hypothetical protein
MGADQCSDTAVERQQHPCRSSCDKPVPSAVEGLRANGAALAVAPIWTVRAERVEARTELAAYLARILICTQGHTLVDFALRF